MRLDRDLQLTGVVVEGETIEPSASSMMRTEALQAPQAVARLLAADDATYRALAADLQATSRRRW